MDFIFVYTKNMLRIFSVLQKDSPMTLTLRRLAPSARPFRRPARSLRLQRIFARLQDGATYADIAAEEGFSREHPECPSPGEQGLENAQNGKG